MKQCSHGFTMAEILTVLLIVMILVAVSFPVFFQVRARTKQSVCESNLHQIYLGIMLYEHDYDELPHLANADPRWYKVYTGGLMLRCPNAVSIGSKWDYFIMAGPLVDANVNEASARFNQLIEECRRKRGDAIPYAFDPNHRRVVDGYQGNGQRVILVRANGSVANVPFRINSNSWTCSLDLGPEMSH